MNRNNRTAKQKQIHFIGIGGIGMSALARYFFAKNWLVSGSDLQASQMTNKLKTEGIVVKIGHKRVNIHQGIDLVVYNRAIPLDNPELLMAKALKLTVLTYAEAIGEITKKYKTIAITGSHGKSTTTALTGLILAHAGLDPTVFVGTELKEFGERNLRIGKSRYLVLEADDFGRAFLAYSPSVALITNIDREHFDTYKTLAIAKKAFLEFLILTRNDGTFILNKDDKNLFSLMVNITKVAKAKDIKIVWYSTLDPIASKIKKIIGIPGKHNLSNAIAAYYAGRAIAISESKILASISRYRGASRRMEYRGLFNGAKVYDDYAHHPTEIKATLQAFREKYPIKKILCVFQPHQARRLQALFKAFRDAFVNTNALILLDIYRVAGRDQKPNKKYNSKNLAIAIKKKYPKKQVLYLKNPKGLKSAISVFMSTPTFPRKSAFSRRESAVLVMMGAGDIVNYTDQLL
ncbi:MAG: UDP-N-acetylmuramate--L-alanine ligase [bacterium]|nr:UDP-N-acetylmuramate--L-alanine ligase [bacterium]